MLVLHRITNTDYVNWLNNIFINFVHGALTIYLVKQLQTFNENSVTYDNNDNINNKNNN